MIDDNIPSKKSPNPELLDDMGEVPPPANDPELYEDVHNKRRRAILREKRTGIAMFVFVVLLIFIIVLFNGFKKTEATTKDSTSEMEKTSGISGTYTLEGIPLETPVFNPKDDQEVREIIPAHAIEN